MGRVRISYTNNIPDAFVAVVRLQCGHAKIVRSNIGVPGEGSRTWCWECDAEVEADHYVDIPRYEAARQRALAIMEAVG